MDRKSKHGVEEGRAGFRGQSDSTATPDSAPGSDHWGDDWVHKLIAMTRPGVEIEFPSRTLSGRPIPFEYDDFS